MKLRRGMGRVTVVTLLLITSSVVAVLPTLGQDTGAEDPAAPESVETRELLQQMYREVYELQLEIARVDSELDRERLVAARRELVAQIKELRARIEAREGTPESPGPAPASPELESLTRELENLGIDADWQALGKIFQDNAQNIGRGLSELGRQLEDIEIEVDEESGQVEIDTRQGGRFKFRVPDEVRSELRDNISKMRVELQSVLSDSNGGGLSSDLRVLLDELPSDLKSAWEGRDRPVKRRVVAQGVFKMFKDFEVADDEIVAGDVVVVGGDVYVAGEVQGNTWVLFGDILVEGRGEIAQDALSVGGEVLLDENSRVKGRMMDAGSILPGIGISTFTSGGGSSWILHSVRVATLALMLLLGFAVVGDRIERIVDHGMSNPGRDFVSGLLWFPATLGGFVVASVGLAISVIGIPVVIVLTVVFAAVMLMAYITACNLMGRFFFRLFAGEDGRADWIYALIGLALLELTAFASLLVPEANLSGSMALHILDYLVKFLALALGFGSLVATRVGGRREEVAELGGGTPALPAGSES